MSQQQIAIYARVSSKQQAEDGTIESQLAALQHRVEQDGFHLPEELTFVDEGYSGANLVRPGLERLRDLVALKGLDCLYVHSPDRLARKYAYQVLLVDEFQRAGVEVIFLNRELSETPEDELLLQVQGIIAEYERAKILERCRRGKRHAAQTGQVSVLSGAPYGYRYVTKEEGGGQARYEVLPEEARVVRQIFQWIGLERVSIGDVCRRLQKAGVRTRTDKTIWDRSAIWGMLKNPAYKGLAAFGKTRAGPMAPRLRPQRGNPPQPRRPVSITSVPEEDWVLIPVPALVDEALFDAVQLQLEENRKRSRQSKRGARYLLQGLLVCAHCQYAYYGKPVSRKSAKGQVRDYAYYRCIGTDAYRFGGERICDNIQVRTDILDQLVWHEVCTLLEEPQRLEQEYQRRLQAPSKEGEDLAALEVRIVKVRRGVARLIDSYAEGFIEKQEFEPRIRRLRQRLADLQAQAQQITDEVARQAELRLVITRLEQFALKVSGGLAEANWSTKRELIRTLVKRVEIGKEVNVVFRVASDPFDLGPERGSLQHRWRGQGASLRRPFMALNAYAVPHHPRFQKAPDDPQQPLVAHMSGQTGHEHIVIHSVEKLLQVDIHYYAPSFGYILRRLLYRLMRVSPTSKSVARLRKGRLQYPLQHLEHRLLYQPVYHRGYPQPPLPASWLLYFLAKHRSRLIAPVQQRPNKLLPVLLQPSVQLSNTHPVYAGCSLVGLHPLVCSVQVLTLAHPFHQVAGQGSSPGQRRGCLPLLNRSRSGSAFAARAGAHAAHLLLKEA
jgi:site-specific DNA recombinase